MPSESLHDTLSAAYDELSGEPAPEAAPAAETPPEPAQAAPEASPETPPAAERVRDPETGRFAPKTNEKAAPPPEIGKDAAPAQPTGVVAPPAAAPVAAPVPEPKHKAPQSWKPLAREKWAALPPEVQEEIARREGEVPKALEDAAGAKRFQQGVTEVFRPYEMLARAAGQHPVQYAAGLMQTAAALQTGAPPQRAAIVANIIRQFGVDVEQLAAALDGQPAQAQTQQQQPQFNVDEVIERKLAQREQQRDLTRYTQEFGKFEFGNDTLVRHTAAAYIEAKAAEGVEVSPQEAYDYGVAAHPEYRIAMEQRKAADAAKAQVASTQRARAAATSIKSQPAASPQAQPKGLRAVLEAKYDDLSAQ